MMKDIVKPIAVLAGICLVVTALLAFVNQLTLPVIVAAEEKAAAAARSEVLSAAKDFKRLTPEYLPEGVTEVYEGSVHFFGRMHSTEITARLAHAEFDIPFWIYCSPTYREKHPEVWQKIVASKDRRYMTDALPHLLLYLAGIHTELYKESQNVLDDHYDEHRPRVLKHEVDYDVVLNHAKMKQL